MGLQGSATRIEEVRVIKPMAYRHVWLPVGSCVPALVGERKASIMASGRYTFFMTSEELVPWIQATRAKSSLHLILEYFFPRGFQIIAPNKPLDFSRYPKRLYFCASPPNPEELTPGSVRGMGYHGDSAVLLMEENTEEVLYLLRLSFRSSGEGAGRVFRSLRSSLKRMLTSGVVAVGPSGEPGIRHNTLHYSAGAVAVLATGVVWKQPGVPRGSFRPAHELGEIASEPGK